MARQPRRYREGALYEATLKTFQARFFFVPSRWLNLLLIGALAYAQEKFPVRICYVVALSNHIHILFRGADAGTVKAFFCLANGQISKEAQALCGWNGGVFRNRFKVTEITDEPEAQIARLKYLMAQGLKEGLVPHPASWPGVHSARAWLDGSMSLRGIWVNRTQLYEKERAGHSVKVLRRRLGRADVKQHRQRVTLRLSPLPCCDQWTAAETQELAQQLCSELLDEYAEIRSGVRRGWRKRLMDPSLLCHRPSTTKRQQQPRVHAASRESWVAWTAEWRAWLTTYREASLRLRKGVREAIEQFPDGCFVPTGLLLASSGAPPPS